MPAAMIVPEIKSKLLLLVEIAIANIRDKAGINPYDNWVASIPIRYGTSSWFVSSDVLSNVSSLETILRAVDMILIPSNSISTSMGEIAETEELINPT